MIFNRVLLHFMKINPKALRHCAIIFILLLFNYICIAQPNPKHLGSWAMLFNQSRITDKWSLHSEIQFRSYDVTPNTEQLLIRAGINYHHSQNTLFSGGYGWITNYADDGDIIKPYTVNENRTWEQIILRSSYNRVFIEHRYRLEQRWLNINTIKKYQDRIRYLLRITVPINKKVVQKNTLFLSLYDEVFINLTTVPFDRNRAYAALGYQFTDLINLQIGYLAQTVNIYTKQYLQLGLNYNIDFRKKE